MGSGLSSPPRVIISSEREREGASNLGNFLSSFFNNIVKGPLSSLAFLVLLAISIAIVVRLASDVQKKFTYKPVAIQSLAPRDVRISNVTGTALTVSWKTPGQKVTGAVIYRTLGTDITPVEGSVALDSRGGADSFETHHVTITNLKPETEYQIEIISADQKFTQDAEGNPLPKPKTSSSLEVRSTTIQDIARGSVRQSDGVTPASDSLVYLTVLDKDGKGDPGFSALLSTTTDQNGDWSIDVSGILNRNYSAYFSYSPSGDDEHVEAVGGSSSFSVVVDTGQDSPIQDPIILPSPGLVTEAPTQVTTGEPTLNEEFSLTSTPAPTPILTPTPTSIPTPTLEPSPTSGQVEVPTIIKEVIQTPTSGVPIQIQGGGCVMERAKWSSELTFEGQEVRLHLWGNQACQGKTLNFEVRENNGGEVKNQPQNATFNESGLAEGLWVAEYHPNCPAGLVKAIKDVGQSILSFLGLTKLQPTPSTCEANYSFTARLTDDPTAQSIVSEPPNLTVRQTTAEPQGGGSQAPQTSTIGTLPEINLPTVRGFKVNEQTGTANISYPISLPPGEGGLAPSLSLSYSSSSVDDLQGEGNRGQNYFQSGLLGPGWDIVGIPKQFISDWQEKNPVIHDEARAQVIHLSGIGLSGSVELRRKKPWDDQLDWYQNPASNLNLNIIDPTVKAGGGGSCWPNNYYHYWTQVQSVKDSNGTLYEFDRDQAGLYTIRDPSCSPDPQCGCPTWGQEVLGSVYVTRITDVWGNQINFHYTKEYQQISTNTNLYYVRAVRPDYITYGPNQNIRVSFLYSGRNDKGRHDTSGGAQSLFSDQKLSKILVEVTYGTTTKLVRKYELNYWTSNDNWYDGGEWWDEYYRVTDGIVNTGGGEHKSYNPLLKEIREYICDGPEESNCTDTGTPWTFNYVKSDYFSGTGPSNDFLLHEADNGFGGRTIFFYGNDTDPGGPDPRPVRWEYEENNGSCYDGGWQGNYKNADGIICDGSVNQAMANRFRFVVVEKKIYDGMGNRTDIVYEHKDDSGNDLSPIGFVDYDEGYNSDMYGNTDPPGKMSLDYLGFDRVKITTYDFIDENNVQHGDFLRSDTTQYYTFLDGGPGCWRKDPRSGIAKYDLTEDSSGVDQSSTSKTFQFSSDNSCQKRYSDRAGGNYSDNPNFVREPRALLTEEVATGYDSGRAASATRTTYEYFWDFGQTGHQINSDNRGAVKRTKQYGKVDPVNPGNDIAGDERTIIAEYGHNDLANIFNRTKKKCIVSGIVSDPNRNCQTSDFDYNEFFYDSNTSPGVIGSHGAPTSTKTYFDATHYGQIYQGFDDSNGNIISVTDANNNTTTLTFDTLFKALPKTKIDAKGQSTTFIYDFEPEGGSQHYWGVPRKIDGPNANDTVEFTYDDLARVKKVIKRYDSDASPTEERFYYVNDPSRIAPLVVETHSKIDNDIVNRSAVFYDGLGQLLESQTVYEENGKSPEDMTVYKTKYNALGEKTIEFTPYWGDGIGFGTFAEYEPSQYSRIVYDTLGRVRETYDLAGTRTAHNTYFEGGLVVASKDAADKTFYSRSDGLGRQVEVIECLAPQPSEPAWPQNCPSLAYQVISYAYDVLDNLTSVTDPAGNLTTTSYDLAGRKLSTTDPNMGHWTYQYDNNGNILYQTDAEGSQTCYSYDVLNRMVTKKEDVDKDGNCAGGNDWVWYYNYDESGHGAGIRQLTSTSGPNGFSKSFTYDDRGRLIWETLTVDGISHTTGYTYTSSDQLKTVTYPSEGIGQQAEIVTYDYTERGLPKSLTGADAYVTEADYSFYPTIQKIKRGNGVSTDYYYSTPSYPFRLNAISTNDSNGNRIQRFVYSYDNVQDITKIEDFSNNGDLVADETFNFEYDSFHRLQKAWNNSDSPFGGQFNRNYYYNGLGNITQVVDNVSGATANYAYGQNGAGPYAVTTAGGNTYNYDRNGNMTSRTTVCPYDIAKSESNSKLAYGKREVLAEETSQQTSTSQGILDRIGSFFGDLVSGVQQLFISQPTLTTSSEQQPQTALTPQPSPPTSKPFCSVSLIPSSTSVSVGGKQKLDVKVAVFGLLSSLPPAGKATLYQIASNLSDKIKISPTSLSFTWQQTDPENPFTLVGTATVQGVSAAQEPAQVRADVSIPNYGNCSSITTVDVSSGPTPTPLPYVPWDLDQSCPSIGQATFSWKGDQNISNYVLKLDYDENPSVPNGKNDQEICVPQPTKPGNQPQPGKQNVYSTAILWDKPYREWSIESASESCTTRYGKTSGGPFACITPHLGVTLSGAGNDGQYSSQSVQGVTPLLGVDLKADVTGSLAGYDITYEFDCQNDGTYEYTTTTQQSSWQITDLCNYSTSGSYTASVRVTQRGFSVTDTLPIAVTTPAQTTTFNYVANRLTSTTHTSCTGDTTTTNYYYDGYGNLIKKVEGTTTTVYGGKWYEVINNQVVKYYYLDNQLIAMRDSSGLHYLYTDRLGSLSEVTDSGALIQSRQRFNPFGKVRYTSAPLPTSINYTGQRLDSSNGLLHYGSRYYDPVLARFIQPDSIVANVGNSQSLNSYSYVLNNPLKYTDSSGHREEECYADPTCGSGGGSKGVGGGGKRSGRRGGVERGVSGYLDTTPGVELDKSLVAPTIAQTYSLSCEPSLFRAVMLLSTGVELPPEYENWEKFILANIPYTDNPNTGFVGNYRGKPGSTEFLKGYGVYAGPLQNEFAKLGIPSRIMYLSDDDLMKKINEGYPVIIWGTAWGITWGSGQPVEKEINGVKFVQGEHVWLGTNQSPKAKEGKLFLNPLPPGRWEERIPPGRQYFNYMVLVIGEVEPPAFNTQNIPE